VVDSGVRSSLFAVVTTTDAQVRKLMEEFNQHGQVGRAAMLANMDRKTARKYLLGGKLPSETRRERTYRTRPDPFDEDWGWVEERLAKEPRLGCIS